MRILVIGSGAREHAPLIGLAQDPTTPLRWAPDNGSQRIIDEVCAPGVHYRTDIALPAVEGRSTTA